MDNLPEPQLKKEGTIVKVFANEILIIKKTFQRKEDGRSEWMERIAEALKGCKGAYFEISNYYTQRNVEPYEYVKRQRERRVQQPLVEVRSKIKKPSLIEPPQPEKSKFVTPTSFERPKAIYSNKNWD